ncbi:MAG TPA: 3-oxoacyl-ACP synthase, partial [Bacteroidia bacterium]|nr:3-oxoacyl-ACP synthase [Bacteroidia bacterium]
MHEIKAFCSVINNSIFLNGKKVYQEEDSATFPEFSIRAYRHMSLTYPKFFKMDPLCKLAFLAAET